MGESVNISSALTRMAQLRPFAPAVFCPDGGRDRWGRTRYTHLSYRQLDDWSDALARGLEIMGIGKGVRTVLMVRPSLEFFALSFAMFRAGVVPVVVDPGIGLKHLKACLANAEPEAFVGIPAAHAARLAFRWASDSIHRLVTVGGWFPGGGPSLRSVEALGRRHGARSTAVTAADDVAAILFTSGSTGPPKGVVYNHGNFLAQIEALRSCLDFQPGEVDLPTFPLFGLFDPALGMTTIIPDMDPTRPAKVDPMKIVQPIHDFGVTNLFGSPALLNTVGRWGVEHELKLPTVKRVVSAGAPLSPQIIETFLQLLPDDAQVFTGYGATEALPVATIGSDEILGDTRVGTDRGRGVCVGRPVDGMEVAIIPVSDEPIDEWRDELRLPPLETGEIVVRGPQVTRSYYRAAEHTAAAKIHDGDGGGGLRHRMGDVGYLDEQGRLWMCGRKSQRVMVADDTMFTVPCEGVFNSHPRVYRSALVGADRDGETEPVLCVELHEPADEAEGEELRRDLLELAGRHPHTARIRVVLFHDGFPVDIRHNAKIDRAKLAVWARRQLRRRRP